MVSSLTFTFPNGLEKSKSLHNFPGVGLQGECGLWTFIHEGDEVDLSQLNGASSFSLWEGSQFSSRTVNNLGPGEKRPNSQFK